MPTPANPSVGSHLGVPPTSTGRPALRWAGRVRALVAVAAMTAAVLVPVIAEPSPAGAAPTSTPAATATGAVCGTTTDTEYATGTTAAAIGWAGNSQAVVACLSGSFVVVNTQKTYGYGVYNAAPTTWTNVGGYLPALRSTFRRAGATVTITNFGDRVVIGGHPYVAVYSRVTVTNPTGHAVTVDPEPTPGLVALHTAPNRVRAHTSVHHDYAVLSDSFGATSAYPAAAQLRAAGGYDRHFAHMRSYWTGQVAQLAQIRQLPDQRLGDAYRPASCTPRSPARARA